MFANPEHRGIVYGLWQVARGAFAGKTDDQVTLDVSDVEWITGRAGRHAVAKLQRVCGLMGYSIATLGANGTSYCEHTGECTAECTESTRPSVRRLRYRVHVRNLERKQGWGSTNYAPPIPSTDTDTEEEESATPSRRTTPSPDACVFARKFRASLIARTPDAKLPKKLKRWEIESDRMLRIDKRDLEEATELATWLFNDPGDDAAFWRGNVRAVPKFRTQYERLREHRARGQQKEKRGGESELKKAVRGVARRRGLVRDGDGEEDRTVRGHARRLPGGEEPGS